MAAQASDDCSIGTKGLGQEPLVADGAIDERRREDVAGDAVLRQRRRVGAQHLDEGTPLGVRPVLQQALQDEVPEGVAAQMRSLGDQLANEVVEHLAREVFNEPLQHATANRMPRREHGPALELFRDEQHLARRQLLHNLLKDEFRVRGRGRLPHVPAELAGEGGALLLSKHLRGPLQHPGSALPECEPPGRLHQEVDDDGVRFERRFEAEVVAFFPHLAVAIELQLGAYDAADPRVDRENR
mmetsp:Transcript_52736/g.160305  ORF Transcript_52736/g.160305 Transcript_52736/m.160305 type:complete len:242 (-) Transcript_52736:406-1131(-)